MMITKRALSRRTMLKALGVAMPREPPQQFAEHGVGICVAVHDNVVGGEVVERLCRPLGVRVVGNQTTVTATVVGLNKKKGTITLKGPRGKTVTLAAREPKRLEPVEVGDLIEAVYTEAVAISVEKPSKP